MTVEDALRFLQFGAFVSMVPILILVIVSLLVGLLSSAGAETDNFSPKLVTPRKFGPVSEQTKINISTFVNFCWRGMVLAGVSEMRSWSMR